MIYSPRALPEGNKSHNHELKADKRLIFTLAITAVTDKEIQARNEARIPQKKDTKRATSWSTRVLICKGDKSLIPLAY